MRILWIVCFTLLIGCSQDNQTGRTIEFYKDVLLRTVQSYSIDRNLDSDNPVQIDFFYKFEGQLAELVLETSQMNSFYYSIVNSDSAKKIISIPSLGQLKVELNGNDITSCIVSECNQTKCVDQASDISSLTGNFAIARMYLNLSKIKSSCSGVSFTPGEMNSLKLFENGSSASQIKGARIRAQVLVYNRPYKVQDIQNLFEGL